MILFQVIELHLQMTKKMKEIQVAVLELIGFTLKVGIIQCLYRNKLIIKVKNGIEIIRKLGLKLKM